MVEIFTLLSRTDKLKKNRKRKRGDLGTDLFDIRRTKDKDGVGMFAVANIGCGDVIISHEEPIVACSARPDLSVCSSCATPVGTLGKDHLKANDDIIDGIDPDGLVFTTSHTKCKECNDTVWCSRACSQKCQEQHCIFCSSATLKEFCEKEEGYTTILRMAARAIAVALSHFTSLSKDTRTPIDQFFWWREYGSHPVWWKVGSSIDGKKDKSVRFCAVLQRALIESISLKRYDVEETVIREICSVHNVGSVLGMLQCNGMEYQYQSPAGQYMEQLREDSCEYFPAEKQPISGSGLYPLLSLANHDCNPNASIEFLEESNRGTMVATRNILVGDEICITYVCNGGVGSGDDAEYFRHFNPTRTWIWLNNKLDDAEEYNDDEEHVSKEDAFDDPHDDSASVDVSCVSSNNDCKSEQNEDAGDQSLLEGSTVEERAKSLIEYGFHCRCSTCIAQSHDNTLKEESLE